MYTPKKRKQKHRRKTQKQHCLIDEALLINYPFPNKIFNFPKCLKGMSLDNLSSNVPALQSIYESSIRKAIKGGVLKGGSTNLEIGLASWFNYIIGLKDSVIEHIIETYKNTLPIPVIGEIVKIVSEYFSLMSIPILWLVGLISNAFTSLVGTVKTNWHYVLILITSLDLIEWAGTAVNASGDSLFQPATTVASFLNNTVLNFGAVVNFVWAIVATIWTIVVYWIPSNLFMFIFSNSLFSFSIVMYIFVVLIMWISEHLNPSYYIRMMDAKQQMNNIHKQLKDFSKNNSNMSVGEFMNKEKKLEEELKKAKEIYREAKKQYEEDLKKNHPEEYTVYNLKKLKDDMEKAENENKESESAVKKATRSNIEKAKKQAEKTAQKYQAAKEAYDTAKEAYDAEMSNKNPSSSLSSTTSGGNRSTRKQKQKEVNYESVVHRLLSKKSLANFKNLSTAELEEIRKKQPFPFEIALALGFIKKTEDGYELVEKRIQKLKEPIIQSISFLNHRCKGCKPKTQKGGSIDTPLENYELDSLREALTGVKMLHTASIYAITREAVEMEEKHKMTGGGDSQDPDPFLNIPQTLNQLKSADMDWLLKKSPEEFEIAEKWGIVVNGELSHSAKEILQDTAEMSKSMVKKRIPKASQKVLFPS
jgi:hypothetical protein